MIRARPDIRSASAFVKANWKTGDALATTSGNIVEHYQPDLLPRMWIGEETAVAELQELTKQKRRLWIVVSTESRRGLDSTLQAWLFANTRHAQQFQKLRLDYTQPQAHVYLFEPGK